MGAALGGFTHSAQDCCCGTETRGVGTEVYNRTKGEALAKTQRSSLQTFDFKKSIPQAFVTKAQGVIHGSITLINTCKKIPLRTEAGLAIPTPVEKAGGACVYSLLSTLDDHQQQQHRSAPLSGKGRGSAVTTPTGNNNSDDHHNPTYGALLTGMHDHLKERGYHNNIPQVSSSRLINLKENRFSVWNPSGRGRSKALLVGINYKKTAVSSSSGGIGGGGESGELSGAISDVRKMREYLLGEGYDSSPESMVMLVDDLTVAQMPPTADEIVRGLSWLVEGANPGDSLFFHFSGHAGAAVDETRDEEDGMDETLVPLDYQDAGQIIDDTIYQLLVAPLPRGVNLVCVFDCCHSGTILELPFIFSATEENVAALQAGKQQTLYPNGAFSMSLSQQLLAATSVGVLNQLTKSTLGAAQVEADTLHDLASPFLMHSNSAMENIRRLWYLPGGLVKDGSLHHALTHIAATQLQDSMRHREDIAQSTYQHQNTNNVKGGGKQQQQGNPFDDASKSLLIVDEEDDQALLHNHHQLNQTITNWDDGQTPKRGGEDVDRGVGGRNRGASMRQRQRGQSSTLPPSSQPHLHQQQRQQYPLHQRQQESPPSSPFGNQQRINNRAHRRDPISFADI